MKILAPTLLWTLASLLGLHVHRHGWKVRR
jgi:hypothetical protein